MPQLPRAGASEAFGPRACSVFIKRLFWPNLSGSLELVANKRPFKIYRLEVVFNLNSTKANSAQLAETELHF